jgi:hypothetical protein
MFSGESSNYEKMEAQLRAGAELSNMEFERIKTMDKMAEDAFKEEQRRTEERIKMAAEANEAIMAEEKRKQQIFEDTMNIMSQNFSDAFAGFVMGTKSASDAFNSMTQSIISAMVRMASQKAFEQIFGYIASAASMLGGGSTGMGTNTTFAGGETVGDFMGMVRHGGGTGSSGGSMRSIPASYFNTAPRLHSGMMPNEYAAILDKKESVLTPGQLSAVSGGGGSTNYYIQAMDVKSFMDYLRKSGGVPMLVSEDVRSNGVTRKTMKSKW